MDDRQIIISYLQKEAQYGFASDWYLRRSGDSLQESLSKNLTALQYSLT